MEIKSASYEGWREGRPVERASSGGWGMDEKWQGVIEKNWSLSAIEVEMQRLCPTLNAILSLCVSHDVSLWFKGQDRWNIRLNPNWSLIFVPENDWRLRQFLDLLLPLILRHNMLEAMFYTQDRLTDHWIGIFAEAVVTSERVIKKQCFYFFS